MFALEVMLKFCTPVK